MKISGFAQEDVELENIEKIRFKMAIEFKTRRPIETERFLLDIFGEYPDRVVVYSEKDMGWIEKNYSGIERKGWMKWLEKQIGRGTIRIDGLSNQVIKDMMMKISSNQEEIEIKFYVNSDFLSLDPLIQISLVKNGSGIVGGKSKKEEIYDYRRSICGLG